MLKKEGNRTVKKLTCILLCILMALMIPLWAGAEGYRVFFEQETDPFGEEEELLVLRIAGSLGGDCMLMTCGGESLLIDTGDAGLASFLPSCEKMMQEAGLGKHVDALYTTHPHRDHLAGLQEMLEAGYTFDRIYTAFPHDYSDGTVTVVQKQMIASAEERNIPVVDVKTGDTFTCGTAEITVIRLTDDKIGAGTLTNDQSAMIRVKFGECSVLLTGDIEGYAPSELSRDHDLKSDIIKAPHHGLGGINPRFLKNADPEFVFITNGSYDTKATINTLKNYAYNRYLCASWGEITLRTNGEKWIISQEPNEGFENHVPNTIRTMLRRK